MFLLILSAAAAVQSVKVSEKLTLPEVLRQAKAEKKMVLLHFTGGPEWCGDCQNLQTEVMGSDEFKNYAATNFVVFEVDPVAVPQDAALEQLVEDCNVRGWPSLALMDAAGHYVDKVAGYTKGDGPEKVIKQIRAIHQP